MKIYVNDPQYLNCVEDILFHPMVQSMHQFTMHGGTSCLKHSMNVSYLSYRLCKKYDLDYVSAARAALLHDFFLYDWHKHSRLDKCILHGITHSFTAVKNARALFFLSPKERMIIYCHMFPIFPIPPLSLEGIIVSCFDKYCAFNELIDKFVLAIKF